MVNIDDKVKQAIKFAGIKELNKIARTSLFYLEQTLPANEFAARRKNILDSLGNSIRNFESYVDDCDITMK